MFKVYCIMTKIFLKMIKNIVKSLKFIENDQINKKNCFYHLNIKYRLFNYRIIFNF